MSISDFFTIFLHALFLQLWNFSYADQYLTCFVWKIKLIK